MTLEVHDLKNLSQSESQYVKEYLQNHQAVYLTSRLSDSVLFEYINQYRVDNSLKALPISIRLDTLARIVTLKNSDLPQLKHYKDIAELFPIYDLLNVENLQTVDLTTVDYTRIGARLNYDWLLQVWRESPRHNVNMLKTLGGADVGAASVIIKVTRNNDVYKYSIFAAFELDNARSKRELNDKFDNVNRNLIKKFKK